MRSRTFELPKIESQRTNVRPRATLHHKSRHRAFDTCETKFKYFYFHGFEVYRLILPRQLMRRPPFHFFRRICWRGLPNFPHELLRQCGNFFRINRRGGIRTEPLAIGIVRIRCETKSPRAAIAFAPAGIKTREACGATKRQDEHPRRQRIERAEMSNLPKANKPAHRFNNVV